MQLPSIDLSSLPALDTVAGLFGSLSASGATVDDRVIVIMVYVYETVPPSSVV